MVSLQGSVQTTIFLNMKKFLVILCSMYLFGGEITVGKIASVAVIASGGVIYHI